MQQDSPDARAGSGLGRPRRPRISDAETERRMLATAAETLARTGLAVSLEHIRLEDVIREAGVSRSAAYRKWPHKDAFLGDLLLELARGHAPMRATGGPEASALVRETVLAEEDELRSAAGRRRVLVELVRRTAAQDFDNIHGSNQWRTYLALTVTAVGLPAGELRERVREALVTAERTLTDGIANSFRLVAGLLDLRLRDPNVDFAALAHLANAVLRGFVMKTLATPELAQERVAEAFGSAEWTLPALGIATVLTAHLEPGPDDWDDERIAVLRTRLAGDGDLFTDSIPRG